MRRTLDDVRRPRRLRNAPSSPCPPRLNLICRQNETSMKMLSRSQTKHHDEGTEETEEKNLKGLPKGGRPSRILRLHAPFSLFQHGIGK